MKELNFDYKAIIDATLDAVIIIDSQGKIIEWNTNAQEVFDWTKDEVLDRFLFEFIIPERFVEAHRNGIRKYFETGEGPVLNKRIEIVGINKNKKEFPVELTIKPLKVEGKTFFSAFIRDISPRVKMQNTINEERTLFSRMIESISDPIFYKTPSHEYLRCNQAFADIHGKKPDDIIGTSDYDLYNKKDAQEFIDSDLDVIHKKKVVINEEWFKYKNGNRKYLYTLKLPSYDDEGNVIGIVGICRDLTEIKKAESKLRHLNIEMQKVIKKLKENEKYLQGINRFAQEVLNQNTISEIIWTVTNNLINDLDLVDCVIYLFDEEKKNLVQRAAFGPKQQSSDKVKDPLVLPIGKGVVGTVAKTGKSEIITDTTTDSRYVLDDEVRLSEITVPIIADGEVIGIIDSEHPEKNYFTQAHLEKLQTVANLISVRLKSALNQEKLDTAQKSITKLSAAVEQSTLPIVITDSDGIIEFVNPAFERLSGYESSESIGRKTNLLKSGEQSDSFYDNLWETILQGKKWTGEIINRNKSGKKYWVLVSVSPILDINNEVTNFVYIQTDITQLKLLEKELLDAKSKAEEADKSKSQFIANMSHEIRTPLNGIIGMIREFSKETVSQAQEENIASAMKASQHLLSLINDILDITKIDAGEFSISKSHFNIETLLNDVSSILKPQAIDKGIGFKINLETSTPKVFSGDESRIRQILINIAGNSIKFTNDGMVTIDCDHEGEVTDGVYKLVITITDTGIGMDDDFVDNIFQKFQQEDLSITRKYGGTGLGLFISKQLVEIMDGSISVESQKGKGTKVKITLPLSLGDENKVFTKEVSVEKVLLDSVNVLLVEDNELNRVVACNTLKAFNIIVTEAVNGKEAVNAVKENRFDLILMDIQMPEMNGFEATRVIREKLKVKTPIIALTANAIKTEIDKCLDLGMNGYITKPYEEDDLIQLISKHIKANLSSKEVNEVPIKKEVTISELYSLERLKQMSRGNDAFVKKMLTLFVDNFPEYIEQFGEYQSKGNIGNIKKLAHKIKPIINEIGIDPIKDDIIFLNSDEIEKVSPETLNEHIDKVRNVLSEVVQLIMEREL